MEKFPLSGEQEIDAFNEPEQAVPQEELPPKPERQSAFSKMGKIARIAGAIGVGILSGEKASASETSDSEVFSPAPRVESVKPDLREDLGVGKRLTDVVNGMVDKGEGNYRQILTALYGDKTEEILKTKEAYRQKSGRYFATSIDPVSLEKTLKIEDRKSKENTFGQYGPGKQRIRFDNKQIVNKAVKGTLNPELVRAEVLSHEFVHGLQDKELLRERGRSPDVLKSHVKLSEKHSDYALGGVFEREARVADLNRIHQMAFGRPVLKPEDAVNALIVADRYNKLRYDDFLPVMKELGIEFTPSGFHRAKFFNALDPDRFKKLHENSTSVNGAGEIIKFLYEPEVNEEQRREILKEVILTAPGLAMNDSADDSGEMVV